MKKSIAKLIPLLARGVASTAIAASSMFAAVALGGHGDLDPDFADVGRLGPILDLEGPAWSLEALDNDDILLAGGDFEYVCDRYCFPRPVIGYDATNFVSRLSDAGSVDLSFNAARLEHTQVFDVIPQPDGKLVAVGRRVSTTARMSQLIVFRLQPNGPLDTTFGNAGIVELSITDHGQLHMGTSVELDPNGGIVVAGSRANELIVLRLHANGSFDDSFGASGVFVGPENYFVGGILGSLRELGPRVLRVADGGYRVTIENATGCQVVALTAGGALDNRFGSAGIADVNAPWGPANHCNSILAQPDGHLFVAGSAGGQGFATRLLTSGARDSSFSTNAVADILTEATALAARGDDGSIIVAGVGANGASIIRLQANGELDELFGNAGSTLIDLPSEDGMNPFVHDMAVLPDGGILAAGGDDWRGRSFVLVGTARHPFVIRLLGRDGGNAPGVLGVPGQSFVRTSERDPAVVVNVRRTGGDSGSVSVAYQTVANDWSTATGGQDYVEVAGRLTWNDGDSTEQEIRVSILDDNSAEGSEYFRVMLSDAQGGAGLGTRNANIEILEDEDDEGFSIPVSGISVNENGGSVQIAIERSNASNSAASVDYSTANDTAVAGSDYSAVSGTLTWAAGDSESKTIEIPITDDQVDENGESFTVSLSNPTGGAGLGENSTASVTIVDNDSSPPPPPPTRGGGGGTTSLELLALLGLISALVRRKIQIRPQELRPRVL